MAKFINISNHFKWSAEQRDAARAIGEVVDVAFPNVSPHATHAEVLRQAEPLLAVVGPDDVVFCAGEMTLVFYILSQCRLRGNRIVTATTERLGVETPQPDGSVKKEFVFKFVQWRDL
jgi:hypothetical protein